MFQPGNAELVCTFSCTVVFQPYDLHTELVIKNRNSFLAAFQAEMSKMKGLTSVRAVLLHHPTAKGGCVFVLGDKLLFEKSIFVIMA